MLSTRRKPFPIGSSKAVTLPAAMKIMDEVSMAASDQIIMMDTTGEVPADKLLQFFMEYVEPAFQRWWESQKRPPRQTGGLQASREYTLAAVSPVEPLEAEGMALPHPELPLVSCFRCGQLIAWTLDPRAAAVCPRCGVLLRLTEISEMGGDMSLSP